MNRRGFLTRSGLALGALIVGDEVLETLDRLTHRKVWAGHTFSQQATLADLAKRLDPSGTLYPIVEVLSRPTSSLYDLSWTFANQRSYAVKSRMP